jgi:DNA-binding transcriptional MerR regulator
MGVVRPFHRYRGESSFTMPRLLGVLKEQLPLIAPEQTRYRVTTLPTDRTIRFYTARGLVDRPSGHERQLALYGYRHLLQILAVKYLQSHYLPLRKVKSLMEGASNRDLEQLMPEVAPSVWAHRGFTRHDRRVEAAPRQRTGALQGASPSDAAAPAVEASDLDAWHRLEVGPGVELHVHAAALSAEHRERLRGALLRELGTLRGWFDRQEKD